MAEYICRNCGFIQHKTGYSSGCAFTFWTICLVFTVFIGLFAAVAWIVVLFEILFMILTRPRKSNECFKCKANDCVVPIDTPAGKKIYTEFYGEYKEENKFFKSAEEIEQSSEDKKKIENDETDTEPVDFALKTVQSNKDEMKKLYIWTGVIIVFFLILCSCLPLISKLTENTEQKTQEINKIDLNQYPTVYSYGEHLKEIYTNPLFGIYIYLCTTDSKYKSDVNLFNGIYYEKPTAKVKDNTVQNIFIFDKFPDIDKFKNITEYVTLLNAIIEQKPVMGFHRCYVKYLKNYANQAYTYDKENQKYIFYYGAGGNWQADSSSTQDFNVEQFDYTGQWGYKPKTNTQTSPQKTKTATLENSPALQAQYKAEIEKTINIETAKAKKEIDKIYQEADDLYNNIIMTNGYNMENLSTYQIYSHSCEGPVFDVYFKLMNITEKYTGKHKELQTGWYGALANYIEPIMKKYNVSNLNKLSELESYMAEKSNEIETRAKGLYKTMNGENQ